MAMKASRERVKAMIIDTITLLCKNGLEFTDRFRVEATIGVTVDDSDVFLVSMNELVKSDLTYKVSAADTGRDTTDRPHKRKTKKCGFIHPGKRSRTDDEVKREDGSDASDVEYHIESATDWEKASHTGLMQDIKTDTESNQTTYRGSPCNTDRTESDAAKRGADKDSYTINEDTTDDIVFIKEEVTDDLQSCSVEQPAIQSSSHSMNDSYMADVPGGMAWDQMPRTSQYGQSNSQNTQHQQQTSRDGNCSASAISKQDNNTQEAGIRYPYHCPYCQKGFQSTSNLRGHISWHTGVLEFKCHLCSKEYRYKQDLKQHVISNHGAKQWDQTNWNQATLQTPKT